MILAAALHFSIPQRRPLQALPDRMYVVLQQHETKEETLKAVFREEVSRVL